MAFKMKGFMPHGKSPMRQDVSTGDVSTGDVSTEDISEEYTLPDFVILSSKEELNQIEEANPTVTEKRGLRFWKDKQNASSRYDPEKTPINENVQHGVKAGPTYKGEFSMNQDDQKRIQKQIKKQGHFGDIPPSLMKGYGPRNSPSYRARVAEINDHHEYMANFDRFDKGRGKHDLHQQLSRKRPENFSSRFTDFEGNNTYDERGKVRRKYGRG